MPVVRVPKTTTRLTKPQFIPNQLVRSLPVHEGPFWTRSEGRSSFVSISRDLGDTILSRTGENQSPTAQQKRNNAFETSSSSHKRWNPRSPLSAVITATCSLHLAYAYVLW